MPTTVATPTTRYKAKREEILGVASQVFAAKGYHQASMRDIARQADSSLAGLYYYAPSKADLLLAISVDAFDTVLAGAEAAVAQAQTPEQQLAGIVSSHLGYFAAHLDQMKVLSHEAEALPGPTRQAIAERKRRYVRLVDGVLRRLAGDATKNRRLETFILFGMMNWLYTWYKPGETDIERISQTIAALFLHGFPAGSPAAERNTSDGDPHFKL